MNTETATHTTTTRIWTNGGAKSIRFVCSCGRLGSRFAYGHGQTVAQATAKAEHYAAKHVAEAAKEAGE